MKIVLDIQENKEMKENDIIVFKNGKWTVVSRDSFLAKIKELHYKDISCLSAKIDDLSKLIDRELNEKEEKIIQLQNDLVKLAKIVKEK